MITFKDHRVKESGFEEVMCWNFIGFMVKSSLDQDRVVSGDINGNFFVILFLL